MQERRSLDPATLLKGGSNLEGKIAAIGVGRQGSPRGSAKSASLQQCKVFISKDTTSMASKIAKSSETSKMSGCNREEVCDPPSTAENCAKTAKSNSSSSKAEAPHLSKPLRQNCPAKADATQPASARSNDSAPVAGIWKNCSNSNDGFLRKATREDSSKGTPTKVSKEISPKPANSLAHLRSYSLSLNADAQKKLPPIKTSHTSSFKGPSSAKNTANLCSECKAEAEGAVCFIGNDGRVSACTARNAVRLCKNLKCANHNPELLESGSATAGPKKYLISRRHSLNLRPRTAATPNGKNDKTLLAKEDAQALNHKIVASPHGASAATIPQRERDDVPHGCNEFEEIEDNEGSQDDLSAKMVEIDGTASASPHSGRSIGQYQRMRRRSFNVIETHAPAELVILRKQMMQERKQAEEWMLDYAIEEALQKLVPSKDSKVKALVEAFESIMPSKEADAGTSEVGNHQSEGPKTPSKMAIKT